MAILTSDLIHIFQQALAENWGYIYGKTHEMWSEQKQAAYAKEYAGDPDRENSVLYGGRWADHWVTDCSGLFAWGFHQLGGKIAHGSNSIWNGYCSEKGLLSGGRRKDGKPLLPGTAVFTSSGEKHNHIGLFIGYGKVIEAQGAQAGVVTSKITNKKWTHWGELKGIQYDESGGVEMYATVVLPTGATGTTVNMRASTAMRDGSPAGALIDRVPVGATVEVLSDQGTWCQIGYNGLVGYMMSNYLEYTGQGGESGGDVVTVAERLTIETALNEIDKQMEIIRSTLGRG